jgi:hypothetical protein
MYRLLALVRLDQFALAHAANLDVYSGLELGTTIAGGLQVAFRLKDGIHVIPPFVLPRSRLQLMKPIYRSR